MVQLRDSSIICTSYAWALMPSDGAASLKGTFRHGDFAFLGGYMIRSKDGGHTWQEPIIPPSTPNESVKDIFDKTVPAYNRGAMCEGEDGKLYWVVASNSSRTPRRTDTHLFISSNKGSTWNYS
jgi:hypothetical protein